LRFVTVVPRYQNTLCHNPEHRTLNTHLGEYFQVDIVVIKSPVAILKTGWELQSPATRRQDFTQGSASRSCEDAAGNMSDLASHRWEGWGSVPGRHKDFSLHPQCVHAASVACEAGQA
jgi:hypothetical protein